MKFLLCNVDVLGGKLQQDYFTDMLKEIAYGAKYVIKNQKATFSCVAIPINTKEEGLDKVELSMLQYHFALTGKQITNEMILSVANILKNYKGCLQAVNKEKFSVTILEIIDSNDMDIFYTDGSFSKGNTQAAYACCQLLNETTGKQSSLDYFTGEVREYNSYSGIIENGTNNIGELTGIKTAVQLSGDKKFQVIISDSEYSVKAFREWIYTWKENYWRNYANKPIANEALIKETYDLLTETRKEKIILFKWTAGHDNNPFNEECDKLAKSALGISK